jgi:hypothetical protein
MLLSGLLALGGLTSLVTTSDVLSTRSNDVGTFSSFGYDYMFKYMADLPKDTHETLDCDDACKTNLLYPVAVQAAEEGYRRALLASNTTEICLGHGSCGSALSESIEWIATMSTAQAVKQSGSYTTHNSLPCGESCIGTTIDFVPRYAGAGAYEYRSQQLSR